MPVDQWKYLCQLCEWYTQPSELGKHATSTLQGDEHSIYSFKELLRLERKIRNEAIANIEINAQAENKPIALMK